MRILGIGPVSAAGIGIEEFQKTLKEKIVPEQYLNLNLSTLDNYINPRKIRRLDSFSKTALLSAFLAIKDSGIILADSARTGIIIGTGNGPLNTTFEFLDNIIDYGDESSSPLLFANSVHNAAASHISMIMGITGPCLALTTFEHTVSNVFKTAEYWLKSGQVDYVLAGVGDEYHKTADYYIEKKQKKRPAEIKPFIMNNSTYIHSEGFIIFIS